MSTPLAVFDLDNTLLAGNSDHLWGEFLIAEKLVDPQHYRAGNDRFYADYRAGELDIDAFAAFSFEPMVRLGRERLEPLRERFVEQQILPRIAPSAPALLERHRAAGEQLLITTATNRFVTEPIAELLGVESLIATDPEEIDGRFTGRIAGTPNFRDGKITRLKQWMLEQGITDARLTVYSDSLNDLPLLQFADQAIAVDPDEVLRREAAERGWPVISLREAPPEPKLETETP